MIVHIFSFASHDKNCTGPIKNRCPSSVSMFKVMVTSQSNLSSSISVQFLCSCLHQFWRPYVTVTPPMTRQSVHSGKYHVCCQRIQDPISISQISIKFSYYIKVQRTMVISKFDRASGTARPTAPANPFTNTSEAFLSNRFSYGCLIHQRTQQKTAHWNTDTKYTSAMPTALKSW